MVQNSELAVACGSWTFHSSARADCSLGERIHSHRTKICVICVSSRY